MNNDTRNNTRFRPPFTPAAIASVVCMSAQSLTTSIMVELFHIAMYSNLVHLMNKSQTLVVLLKGIKAHCYFQVVELFRSVQGIKLDLSSIEFFNEYHKII